jgi:hypothetical protein
MLVLADNTNFRPPGFSVDFQPLPVTDGPYSGNKFVNFKANGDYDNIDVQTTVTNLDNMLKTLQTPIVRSKFLVSDDTVYQDYLAELTSWLNSQNTNS